MNDKQKVMSDDTALAIMIGAGVTGLIAFLLAAGIGGNLYLSAASGIGFALLSFKRMYDKWEAEA